MDHLFSATTAVGSTATPLSKRPTRNMGLPRIQGCFIAGQGALRSLVPTGNRPQARRRIALRSGNRNAWTTFEGQFASLSLPMNRTSDAPGRSKVSAGRRLGCRPKTAPSRSPAGTEAYRLLAQRHHGNHRPEFTDFRCRFHFSPSSPRSPASPPTPGHSLSDGAGTMNWQRHDRRHRRYSLCR